MASVLKLAIAALAFSSWGCDIIGPTCVARQKRGSVANLTGEVAAGGVVVHRVAYGTQGSQNDAHISWADQFSSGGPTISVFATRVECEDFLPPPAVNFGACAVLARGGSSNCVVASTLIVTHGRGNPERLGNPPEYTLWIVGDPDRTVRYTIDITYFYGPDC
jgi:hypothetical protein